MENPQFEIEMLFGSKHELREAISNYDVIQGYEVKVTKNDAKRMQAKCLKCKWNLGLLSWKKGLCKLGV